MAKDEKARVLRVGVIQDRKVVEERLLRKHGPVSVGQAGKNTFVVPNSALPRSYTLFETKGKSYLLVFERGMNGRIDLGDKPLTLRELARSGRAVKRGNKYALELTDKARGKVVFGDVTLLFQFVDAPPAMPRPQLPAAAKGGVMSQLEWPLVYILLASFVVLGGVGTGMDAWWSHTGQYYEKVYDRKKNKAYELLKAEVQLQRKETPPEEVVETPEEDKEPEVEAPPVEVSKAKPEPKKVVKKVPKKTVDSSTKKKPKSAKERETQRRKLTADVRNKTFLHVLGANDGSGGGELDTMKNGVHASNLEEAFNMNGGVTQAEEGTAASFVGGPSAATKDGSRYKTLSAADKGGKRIRTKTAASESKKSRGEIKVRGNVKGGSVGGQTGTGTIDKAGVARVFGRRKGAIKYCYEKALQKAPGLKGKVTIRFTIGQAGRITDIKATTNSTGNSGVAKCIIGKVKGWRFKPPKGGAVTFSYPFLLDTH